jgi:alkanesulfonate monooxygenase SsuD/methylene tetrahydromethanopterin reductase-like flavin-dependent oxidoreductase (luciferase family)
VTVNQPKDRLRKVLESYREAGGRGPARLQIHLSWAPTEEQALAIAHDQWRSNIFSPPVCWDIETVESFDVIGEKVTPEHVRQSVRVSSDLGQHLAWLRQDIDQGWDELYLHFVGKEQSGFIDAFGEHVLPQLSPTAPQTRAAIA